MAPRPTVIKPDPRENKSTIQVTNSVKDALARIGSKGESYNKIIKRLISHFKKDVSEHQNIDKPVDPSLRSMQLQIGSNLVISKYDRVTISITDKIQAEKPLFHSPDITLEVTYNKPITKENELYQIDLRIQKVIFDNEIYSTKEFFGVLQKDIVYCEEFVYYYLRSILEVLNIEFKKSNYFFKLYQDYFDLARWRTFLLNSKLSPDILSSDVESVLSDLKNEKKNNKLLEDVNNSYFTKIKQYGRFQ